MDGGVFFAREMRFQALDQKLCNLAVGGFDVGAWREEQEAVDRVALDRWQVIALRPQQDRKKDGPGH